MKTHQGFALGAVGGWLTVNLTQINTWVSICAGLLTAIAATISIISWLRKKKS